MGTCRMAATIREAAVALFVVFAMADTAASQALTGQTSGWMPEAAEQEILANYGKLPLRFEANRGQSDPQVDFLARGGGYTLYLTSTEAVFVLRHGQGNRPGVLRMKLIGANPAPRVAGLEKLPGTAHYFVGNDPRAWRTDIPTYAKVEYRDVYPGVALVYYGIQGALEYDFVLAPGADPGVIRVAFEGAKSVEVDGRGDLVLQTARGEIRQRKPFIYQELNGIRQAVSGGYVLKGRDQIAFEVAAYDASRPLVIDPVLTYSTFLGGSGMFEEGKGIAVDGLGNAYVTGQSDSTDFPAPGGTSPTFGGGSDAFVAKLNASGALVYTAYLAGNSDETGFGIAVDSAGNAYVTGFTFSLNFPTLGALQPAAGSPFISDAFVTKLNPTGGLVYSTYLGGSGFDEGKAIAVDSTGNAYVTGVTFSPFPNAAQAAFGGGSDAFVAKVNAGGLALVYSTYLGGSGADTGLGIAVDGSGNAYVTGGTESTNFPVVSAFQSAAGGGGDAFVTKLNASGSRVYSTYLGGSGSDEGRGIAVDGSGNAYVAGWTDSTNFPVASAFQAASGGGADAFVTKFSAAGSALVYSTYLGGSDSDVANAIAVGFGNAHVTGRTDSANFPVADASTVPAGFAGSGDAFVTKFNSAGSAPVYSTYLGGSSVDAGQGIAVDGSGGAHVTGDTASQDFRTESPSQPAAGGEFGSDAFVAKINNPDSPAPAPSVVPFAAFRLREADLDSDDDEFDRDAFKARFTLGGGTDGIKPLEEDVTIQVGSAGVTIPKGSFAQDRKGRLKYKYKGTINGVRVQVSIRSVGDGSFKLTFKGKGEDRHSYARHRRRHDRDDDPPFSWYKRHHRTSAPITVALTIGNDGGTTTWSPKGSHRGKPDWDDDRYDRRGRGGDRDD